MEKEQFEFTKINDQEARDNFEKDLKKYMALADKLGVGYSNIQWDIQWDLEFINYKYVVSIFVNGSFHCLDENDNLVEITTNQTRGY